MTHAIATRTASLVLVLAMTPAVAAAVVQDAPPGAGLPAQAPVHEHPAPPPVHEHPAPPPGPADTTALPPGVPPVTDADRAAAFPDVEGHTVHDTGVYAFALIEQLEWRAAGGGLSWEGSGWIGGDRGRIVFRTEGVGDNGRVNRAEAHVLFGHPMGRWWEVVAGVRQDVRPAAHTWAAIGLQGLTPYWLEVEATAYVGSAGRTHFRFETDLDLLLTNRLIVQPRVELDLYGKAEPGHGIGAGLSSADVGLRVRYEVRREIAPYAGFNWRRRFFQTADLAKAAGNEASDARLVAGLRLWF